MLVEQVIDNIQNLTKQRITQKDLEFAKQNAWQVPEGYFEKVRNRLKK